MKKRYSIALSVTVGVSTLACFSAGTAEARKPYFEEFVKKYVTDTPTTPAQIALAPQVEAVKCGVCHGGEKGAKKKERNAYGTALSKLIAKNEKAPEKIDAALDAAAKESSDATKPDAPTFGALIDKGELPAK